MGASKGVVKFVAFFALFLVCAENAAGKNINHLKRAILEDIISHDEIDVLLPPGNATGGPITVEVFMHIVNLHDINEEKEEAKFTLLLRQKWTDHRLKYENQNLFPYILINNFQLIWTPDFYLPGAKKSYGYDVPSPGAMIRLYPNGTVLSSKKITVTLNCAFDLKNFPFDYQVIQVKFSTYGSTVNDIQLQWVDDRPAVTINKNLKMRFLTLTHFITDSSVAQAITGNYSVLKTTFLMKREFSHYLVQAYMPITMLVIVSWFSFWLDKKLLIPRLIINLTALFTLCVILSEINRDFPKMSYNKAVDYFSGFSVTFIMISLVETVLVHVLQTDSEEKVSQNGDLQAKKVKRSKLQCLIAKLSEKVNYIDVGGRILYPVSYLFFCIVYFAVYIPSD